MITIDTFQGPDARRVAVPSRATSSRKPIAGFHDEVCTSFTA
ncbi:hypothetical protein [Demequina litorisediminis]|nr:hypothetical protein [Demequina litorisediminis]